MMCVTTASSSVEVWDLIMWGHESCLTRESRKGGAHPRSSWGPSGSKVAGGMYHRNHIFRSVWCLVLIKKQNDFLLFFLDCWAGKLLKFCWEFVSSHLQRPVYTNSAMWGRPAATLKGASWRACATQRSSAGKELTDSACATMAWPTLQLCFHSNSICLTFPDFKIISLILKSRKKDEKTPVI